MTAHRVKQQTKLFLQPSHIQREILRHVDREIGSLRALPVPLYHHEFMFDELQLPPAQTALGPVVHTEGRNELTTDQVSNNTNSHCGFRIARRTLCKILKQTDENRGFERARDDVTTPKIRNLASTQP